MNDPSVTLSFFSSSSFPPSILSLILFLVYLYSSSFTSSSFSTSSFPPPLPLPPPLHFASSSFSSPNSPSLYFSPLSLRLHSSSNSHLTIQYHTFPLLLFSLLLLPSPILQSVSSSYPSRRVNYNHLNPQLLNT